jgi:energy-coupling factor transporter ATP-binding protein EcfA2
LPDEPTTGLDPRSKREVQGFIRELIAGYAARDLEEAFFTATGTASADDAA